MIELTRCFGLQQTSEAVVDMLSPASRSAVADTELEWAVESVSAEAAGKVGESWSVGARGSWWEAWTGGSPWGRGSSPWPAPASSGAAGLGSLWGTAGQEDFDSSGDPLVDQGSEDSWEHS